MTCAFIGDSIALGLALASAQPCERFAVVGRNPAGISAHIPNKHYTYVVLSAGSNPLSTRQLRRHPLPAWLEIVRAKVQADKVVWIKPLANRAGANVVAVAGKRGDAVQIFNISNDGLHPRSYRALWRLVKNKL